MALLLFCHLMTGSCWRWIELVSALLALLGLLWEPELLMVMRQIPVLLVHWQQGTVVLLAALMIVVLLRRTV